MIMTFFQQEVSFRVEYTVPSIGREFGSVFLGDKNVAILVVSEGWAKVLAFFMSKYMILFCICHLNCHELNPVYTGQRAGPAERRSKSFPR